VIFVIGTIRVPADAMERLRPAMATVIDATRKEDGCITYAFGEDVLEPGLIRVSEVWRDEASLEAHRTQPHMGPWKALGAMVGAVRDLNIYEGTGASRKF
jgi:quinol monooxygenase YgiN